MNTPVKIEVQDPPPEHSEPELVVSYGRFILKVREWTARLIVILGFILAVIFLFLQ